MTDWNEIRIFPNKVRMLYNGSKGYEYGAEYTTQL